MYYHPIPLKERGLLTEQEATTKSLGHRTSLMTTQQPRILKQTSKGFIQSLRDTRRRIPDDRFFENVYVILLHPTDILSYFAA